MAHKTAFIFPGQGAQYVGMGRDFYLRYATARQTIEEADDLLRYKLSEMIFNGPEADLMLTKHAQVAIYVVSIAIWRVLSEEFPDLKPSVCAGLSLGEYTALTVAGVLPFAQGVPLVQARGTLMHDDCIRNPGTMHVILGLTPEAVEETLKKLGEKEVWIANINCPGQVVISGTKPAVEKLSEALKAAGAKRALPLDVSGAFHSGLMNTAKERLKHLILFAKLENGSTKVVMNVPGDFVSGTDKIKANLIEQVTHPVRWEKGVRAMVADGVERFIEIGPGTTLAGMNKRIEVPGTTLSIEKVEHLETLQEMYATTQR